MRKPSKETELALRIYAVMVRDAQPHTLVELMERTGAPRSFVEPLLKARVRCGVMTSQESIGGKMYTFTPEGFHYVRDALKALELSVAQWNRAERIYNPQTGRPRRR